MDSMITAAAQALAAGDPLGALNRISLRDDAPALALRGIAMAQLGDLVRARELVRRAARRFGPGEAVAQARCVVAEGEIALAARELRWPVTALEAARRTLAAHGDAMNAAHARLLAVRRWLLIGRLDEAERDLALLDPAAVPPASRVALQLVHAGIHVRRLRAAGAHAALAQARTAALQSGIPALLAEVERATALVNAPAARLISQGAQRLLQLAEVEDLQRSKALIVDAFRYRVRDGSAQVALVRRPVLFALARELAQAWPGDASREELCTRVFAAASADASHRARLRVEMGRLRRLLRAVAGISATDRGFQLALRRARTVAVLDRPIAAAHAEILAVLADGASWSSSGLAQALDRSQRTVQRGLEALAGSGAVQSLGSGRARRWMAASFPAFTTSLLLPSSILTD